MFSACFPGVLRAHKVRQILAVFEVFLGILEKAKEKKDRVVPPNRKRIELKPMKEDINLIQK